MGTCNGLFSSCYIAGYALESRCHLGKTIVYDTVSNLSWGVDLRTHPVANMIDKILADPWPPAEELGREVPEAVTQDDCVVSFSFHDQRSPSSPLLLSACFLQLYALDRVSSPLPLIPFIQECYSWEFGDFD